MNNTLYTGGVRNSYPPQSGDFPIESYCTLSKDLLELLQVVSLGLLQPDSEKPSENLRFLELDPFRLDRSVLEILHTLTSAISLRALDPLL